MKKVLVYFTQFDQALGGSEFTPLAFAAELQKSCEVTLALNWKSDVGKAAETLGIQLDFDALKIEYVKPESRFLQKLDAVLPFYRTRKLKQLAKHADLCISTANMFDFGKPAHHFVYLLRLFGDNAFCDHLSGRPAPHGMTAFLKRIKTWLAESILRPMLGIRSTRKILADPREHIYPTSRYVEKVMRGFYGNFNSTVFYPPTIFEFTGSETERDPLQIVCLGQLFPEKRLLDVIEIVERARKITGLDLKLTLGGPLNGSAYVAHLKELSAEKKWLRLAGPVYGKEKERFLLSAAYAIHGERDEAFGIVITEYLKGGVIPIVPDEGGTPEIADDPELTYHTLDDAAEILVHLTSDQAFRAEKNHRCAERAAAFSKQAYLQNQNRLLRNILEGSES